ncbi:MAG: hypothetical protein IKO65_09460 [Victivallales bacterium]|jgi:uncharacterized repeat protein (TIGR04138 family)|nr:hypothetical protein [Victivallales bacterium]
MADKPSQDELLDKCAEQNPAYPRAAYAFVCNAVHEIAREIARNSRKTARHITGQELCRGMQTLLIRDYGRMAADVLSAWNIGETADFGNIVYALVDIGLLSVSNNDSRTDFIDVYRFHDVFVTPFQAAKNNRPLPVIDFL